MEFKYPGVYVEEVPSGVHTITGVSTSTAAFVGVLTPTPATTADLTLAPTRVLSYAGYERLLSPETGTQFEASGELSDQVRQFFLNGGGMAYVAGILGADENGYNAAFTALDREVPLFNLLVLPRPEGGSGVENVPTVGVEGAAVLCRARRAFLVVDPPLGWTDVESVTSGIGALRAMLSGDLATNAAVYWPNLQMADGTVELGPSGSVAGLMARTDATRGVWKAPAGVSATIRGARGVTVPMSDEENGLINPEAVNAIRPLTNGITSWGARTVTGHAAGAADWKYVPVRRLALFLEESLIRGLRFAVFEPNDEPLWAQIRLAAGSFMNGLFRQGAFAGTKASEAYFVKCDAENNPQNEIDKGVVTVLVGFAPLKPAEFVVIQLQQKAGQVQV